MASAVDICNLALARLGDRANVSSINPPEGSAQSEHCARFYPIARDSLLEMHNWGFANKRTALALLASNDDGWAYTYGCPADMLRPISVLPDDASDDYSAAVTTATVFEPALPEGYGVYMPQPFAQEVLSDGTKVIRANIEDAHLRYVARITDTTKFTPLFVDTLGWLLASYLAGPIIKGDTGMAVSRAMAQQASAILAESRARDANARNVKPKHNVSWIAGR